MTSLLGRLTLISGMKSVLYPIEFRKFFGQLEDIAKKLPQTADTKEWLEDIEIELKLIRQALDRQHFRVGFLSASQSGKSTTVNNIVGMDLLPEGLSGTCSSVRVRIKRSMDGKWKRTFRYFSLPALQSWRDVICKELNLFEGNPSDLYTDTEVLDKIRSARSNASENSSTSNVLLYLERLLNSRTRYGDVLSPDLHSPVCQSKSFGTGEELSKDLKRAAQHPPDLEKALPSETTLIEEISVEIPAKFIHENLELIDLPGLGTTNKQDILGTTRFLRELDAAFMLAKATDNLANNRTFEEFLDAWSMVHRNVAERIWLTLTFWCGIGRHLIHGRDVQNPSQGRQTVFDTIQEMAVKLGFNLERIVFLDNEFHRQVRRGVDKAQCFSELRVDLVNGIPQTPSSLTKHRLKPVFEAMFDDGGVSTIRSKIENELFPVIRQQQTELLSQSLLGLAGKIRTRIQSLIRASSLSVNSGDERDSWLNKIHELLGVVMGRNNKDKELANFLTEQVHQHINLLLASVSKTTSRLDAETESLSDNFKSLVDTLGEKSTLLVFDKEIGYFKATSDYLSKSLEEYASKSKLPLGTNSPAFEFSAKVKDVPQVVLSRLRRPLELLKNWAIPAESMNAALTVDEYTLVMHRVVPQVVFEIHQQINHILGSVLLELQASVAHYKSDSATGLTSKDLSVFLEELSKFEASLKGTLATPVDSNETDDFLEQTGSNTFSDDILRQAFDAPSASPEENDFTDSDNDPNKFTW